MRRGVFLAALLLAVARGAAAQVDSGGRHPPAPIPPPPLPGADSLARRDSTKGADTTRDTMPRFLPIAPALVPQGPLPRGSRYVFTADSFAFSDTRTLSDLLIRVPGVFIARGGLWGQAETVLYGGRGPASLEVYWDGVPYIPLGRDSVYLDPARIPLAPLERVEVVALPATLRVYLTSVRQSSTAPGTDVGITTGALGTSGYRASFLGRSRSGLGLSLVADWNDVSGNPGSASTPFHDTDLWFKAEYVPSVRFGASMQILSSAWNRGANATPLVDDYQSHRTDDAFRVFYATRRDGLGPRVDLLLATTSVAGDTLVGDRSLSQASLRLSSLWPRASASLTARTLGTWSPFVLDGDAAWTPFDQLTLSLDGWHARYLHDRVGNRLHLAAGLLLPLGFSAHGDLARGKDLQAPWLTNDTLQTTSDLYGGIRWNSRRVMLEVGGARRDMFTPIDSGFAVGLRSVGGLSPTPATNYLSAQARIDLLPGLSLSGWYFNPVRGGGDFEPPQHARWALTFYSKFWRQYKSGIYAFRAEVAEESWTGEVDGGLSISPAGVSTQQALVGATFIDFNMEIRVAGLTIYWAVRNARAYRGTYVPGLSYPINYQFYGVRWHFIN